MLWKYKKGTERFLSLDDKVKMYCVVDDRCSCQSNTLRSAGLLKRLKGFGPDPMSLNFDIQKVLNFERSVNLIGDRRYNLLNYVAPVTIEATLCSNPRWQ